MSEQNLIQPVEEDPYMEKSRLFWLSVGENLVRNTPKRIEGAAKQMITVAGILVGLYFNAVTLTGIKTPLPASESLLFVAPMIVLLISLTCSLMIFMPNKYRMEMRAPGAAELIYKRTVKSNYRLLTVAGITLLFGILLLAFVLWAYLS
jgi:hypothetical protein